MFDDLTSLHWCVRHFGSFLFISLNWSFDKIYMCIKLTLSLLSCKNLHIIYIYISMIIIILICVMRVNALQRVVVIIIFWWLLCSHEEEQNKRRSKCRAHNLNEFVCACLCRDGSGIATESEWYWVSEERKSEKRAYSFSDLDCICSVTKCDACTVCSMLCVSFRFIFFFCFDITTQILL